MNIEVDWLVEEYDFVTGENVFSQQYLNFNDAHQAYINRKNRSTLNIVYCKKVDRKLLLE